MLRVGADTAQTAVATLTTSDVDGAFQVGSLLGQPGLLASFMAGGAHDQGGACGEVAKRSPETAVVVPLRSGVVASDTAETALTQRDRHLRHVAEHGRRNWQQASSYRCRALVEAGISRFKRVIGDGLRSRTDRRHEREVALTVSVLNRMLELGRPEH